MIKTLAMNAKANQKKRLLALASEMAGESSDSDDGIAANKVERPDAKQASSASSSQARPEKQHDSDPGVAKEKAFAWMDSDDELDHGPGRPSKVGKLDPCDGGQRSRSRSRSRHASPERKKIEVADIRSFGDFVRNSEDLVVMVPSMTSSNLLELLESAVRCSFFDGDLIGALWKEFQKRLSTGDFTPEKICEILKALLSLNAYDAGVFHAAALFLQPQIVSMARTVRLNLINIYEARDNNEEQHFVTQLKTLPGLEIKDRDVDDEGKSACVYWIRGCCWAGKKCVYSHEAGLTLKNENRCVMINGNQAKDRDTYMSRGGPRIPLC